MYRFLIVRSLRQFHSRKIKFLSKLQLSDNILFKTSAKSILVSEELVSLSCIYAAI